jgi:fatty acid desaturase
MGHIILGLIITGAGVCLVIQSEWFLNNFGRLSWFEDKLGTEGGSRLGYKLVGIIMIFVGIVILTGSGNDFMGWLLSPLLQYSQPK